MATTIDTLQVEIQSNSTGVARSIDDLAESLGKLKENGTVSVAIKNLNSLRKALHSFSNVPSSASKIASLASSLERLKAVGSVTSIANSLGKLSASMRSVGDMDLGRVAPKLAEVAGAVKPLSDVKAGGLNTMVNALTKLDKVTRNLDDATINRFAERIAKLNAVLGPLSTKMTTISAGFTNINRAAKSASSGVKDFGEEVNSSALNMSSFISVAEGIVQVLEPVINAIHYSVEAAIEWDGIAARFGRGFGSSAQETYEWIQRLNEEMGINVQQFMQYSSVYATMLTGFGVAVEDATKMALGYTELTYDIWAGYNDIYKNFEDAADAVRSAIAGEVEPIRRAGFTIVESTLEQTAANHGLSISLEKATESQKSYLRYLTLVDQAHAQGLVGTYADELDNAEGLVRTLTQQVKSLAQAFGSLFLPILIKVLPWMQAFVELLTDAVHAIAEFFGVTIQEVKWDSFNEGATGIENIAGAADGATGALGSAAKAAEDLKKATIGIDELNVISPPSSSSGSGGSGSGSGGGGSGFDGLDVDSLWDESIFDQVQSQVDEIKEKFKSWLPVLAGIGTALGGLALTKLLDNIDKADIGLGKLGKAVSVAGISIAVGAIVWDLTGAYLESGSLADLGKILGTTAIGAALGYWLAGPAGAAMVIATSGIVSLTKLAVELKNGTVDFGDPQTWATLLIGGLEAVLGGVVVWKTLSKSPLWGSLGTAIKSGMETAYLAGLYALDYVKPFTGALTTGLTGVAGALGISTGWVVAIVAAIVGAIALALTDYDFTEIGHKIGKGIGKALRTAIDWVKEIGSTVAEGLSDAIEWVAENWDELSIIEIGFALIEGLFKGIADAWDNFWGNIGEFIDGLIQGFKDGFEVNSPSKIFMEIGGFLVDGLWLGIKSAYDTIVSNVIKWAEDLLQEIIDTLKPSAIKDRISELWTTAKNWYDNSKAALKEYTPSIGSILDKVKTAWTTAKTWYDNSKAKLKEYTPTIGSIYEKLKAKWDSAKEWYDNKKSKLKEYTPNIGSIYEKLKARWDNARDWYNNKKSKLKEYTPSIGSIYDKVKARWDNARTWWNNKKSAMSTYTPNIGSIKDKLSSAWSTAKKWWSNNVKLSIPSLSFKVTYSTSNLNKAQKAIVKALGLSGWPKLSFAANGGIFDAGSLVWAGERGPEVLANAGGGRTGVMNVQQMQDAVYEGVYAAVVSAMKATGDGGNQAVNVYLDGRLMTANVEKHQRERGASIMGNQVYSY